MARVAHEDKAYTTIEETQPQPITLADGYLTFTRHFKYLGLHISYNRRDDLNIESRLVAASQSIGALSNVRGNLHLDLYRKYLLFHVIPMNLLLWGCKTWSLRQVLLNKLEIFLHRNIRSLLEFMPTQVNDDMIRNEHVRRKFYNIPQVCNMITARQIDFVGKVVGGEWHCPAKHILTKCCNRTRLIDSKTCSKTR